MSLMPVHAYLDTTPKGFNKPQPLLIKPYKYQRPKHEIYMDQAAEYVAPKVFGSVVTGPAGLMINAADKAIQLQENQNSAD